MTKTFRHQIFLGFSVQRVWGNLDTRDLFSEHPLRACAGDSFEQCFRLGDWQALMNPCLHFIGLAREAACLREKLH